MTLLGREPALSYFKASEARYRKGCFATGWSRPLIDERIYEMANLICGGLIESRVHCTLYRSDFNDLIRSISSDSLLGGRSEFKNPYWMCFYGICIVSAHVLRAAGRLDDLEFIFDEHGSTGLDTVQHWDVMKSINTSVQNWFNLSPSFCDDKICAPLQAADLYAWNVHSSMIKYYNSESNEISLVQTLFSKLPSLGIHMDRSKLRKLRRSINSSLRDARFARLQRAKNMEL